MTAILQTLGVTASSTNNAPLNWAENFAGNGTLTTGINTTNVSTIDGANNTKTNIYQFSALNCTQPGPIVDPLPSYPDDPPIFIPPSIEPPAYTPGPNSTPWNPEGLPTIQEYPPTRCA